MSNKLASVPYDTGKSFDFYDDKMIFDSKEIPYDIIESYGYVLIHQRNSVNFIPTSDVTRLSIQFSVGGEPIVFTRSASAIIFNRSRHQDVQLIFSELVRCIDVLLAPAVLEKFLSRVDSGDETTMGPLTFSKTSIRKKTMFGQKEMEEYGSTTVGNGAVTIREPSGKVFCSVSLFELNAPLLKYVLDGYFGPK